MSKTPSGTFYRHVLADAWGAVRKNRALWVLGFFVSFLGNGGVYELLVQGTGRLGLTTDFGGFSAATNLLPSGDRISAALAVIGPVNAVVAALLALALIGIVLAGLWVVISSQGGLIIGLRDALKGRSPKFRASFAAGHEAFKPLLALAILSRVAVTAFFYLLLSLLVLLLTKATVLASLAYLLGFLIFIPLTVVIGFVMIYAACYITLQRLPFIEALEAAVALFRRYWLISLESALLLFCINVVVTICVSVAFGAIGVALIPLAVGADLLRSDSAYALLAVLGVGAAVLAVAAVGAGLAAFQYAVWVALFQKLHTRGHGAASKISRLFHRLVG